MTEPLFEPPAFDPDEKSPAVTAITSGPTEFSRTCDVCGEVVYGRSTRAAGKSLAGHKRRTHPPEDALPKAETPPAKPKPRGRPAGTPKKKREEASELLTQIAGLVGSGIAMVGVPSAPAGLALKLESPLVGPALDKAIAGTIVDSAVVQPLMKTKGRFDEIGPLIMFPVLVGLMDKSPAMQPQLYPLVRMAVAPMLPQLVKQLQKQAEQEQAVYQAAQELAQMDPTFAELFSHGGDPVDAILTALFPTMAPAPNEEENVSETV